MKKIVWGIIGCGDVAEVKSGPAFYKLENSQLKAVMRRDLEKAKDFAQRHKVRHWYNDAADILKDPEIDAVYIATPPLSHLQYTLDAIKAGKHVYLEKPMVLNSSEARQLVDAVEKTGAKVTVAHYRRNLPAFLKVKSLLESQAIGKVLFADIQILQSLKSKIVAQSDLPWRLDPKVSGGGLFHDLAPHQIDLMYQYFGGVESVKGYSVSRINEAADDLVNGIIQFKNGVQCRGVWSFNHNEADKKDECIIYGTEGHIKFSFFGEEVKLCVNRTEQVFQFNNPQHVQQPMIAETINYFLGQGENPCSVFDAFEVIKIMDAFTEAK